VAYVTTKELNQGHRLVRCIITEAVSLRLSPRHARSWVSITCRVCSKRST
jgi:hypothetical protein